MFFLVVLHSKAFAFRLFVLEIFINELKKLPRNSDISNSNTHPSLGNLKYLVTQVATHATTILNIVEQKIETVSGFFVHM